MSSLDQLRPLLLVAGLVVAGCGGGGSAPMPTPPSVVSTSIIPVAGAPGAVLATDATTLRPLIAGGVWTYRGHATASTGAKATIFDDVVTQKAVTAGTSEDSSNQFNEGTSSVQLAQAAGIVTLTDPSGASLGVTSYPELRSPVRVPN